MRITHKQKKFIIENSQKHFGVNVAVWLFGSRADDTKKGGDIDLYVETDLPDAEIILAKIKFISSFYKVFGEQRIDLVLHQIQKDLALPIYEHAKNTGVKLCP